MAIDYKKLRIVLAERNMEWVDLRKNVELTTKTTGKLRNNEYVDMETLEKICRYLVVQLGDIAEFKFER